MRGLTTCVLLLFAGCGESNDETTARAKCDVLEVSVTALPKYIELFDKHAAARLQAWAECNAAYAATPELKPTATQVAERNQRCIPFESIFNPLTKDWRIINTKWRSTLDPSLEWHASYYSSAKIEIAERRGQLVELHKDFTQRLAACRLAQEK